MVDLLFSCGMVTKCVQPHKKSPLKRQNVNSVYQVYFLYCHERLTDCFHLYISEGMVAVKTAATVFRLSTVTGTIMPFCLIDSKYTDRKCRDREKEVWHATNIPGLE